MRALLATALSICFVACAGGADDTQDATDPVGEGGAAGVAGGGAGTGGSGASGSPTAGTSGQSAGSGGVSGQSGGTGGATAGKGGAPGGQGGAPGGQAGAAAGKGGASGGGAAGQGGAAAGKGGAAGAPGGQGGAGGSAGGSGGPNCDHKGPGCNPPDSLGEVKGDNGSDVLNATDTKGRWLSVNVHEDSGLSKSLSVRADVKSPPGMKFETYLYWLEKGGVCPGKLIGQPDASGTSKASWSDTFGIDDDRIILVEVRYVSGDSCTDSWALTVSGNK